MTQPKWAKKQTLIITSAFTLLIILWFGLLPSATGLAQHQGEAVLFREDFQSGAAAGWELDPGWKLIQEGDNWVLSGQGHTWARPPFPGKQDFRLTFRLKLLRGRIHLVYRLNDSGRYFIGYEENRSDLNKQYWPDTFLGKLVFETGNHPLGSWQQIEITGEGDTISMLVDGRLEWQYQDSEALGAGSFAFETQEDSQAYIDDILVYGDAPEPTPTAETGLTWQRTGGPLGGLGYDVRMRPGNPDMMYVTDAYAGVFISEDGGDNWYPSNQGISTRAGPSGDAIPVFCLTIDPHNSDIVWIGTQNVRGLFKSTDAGQSWTKMDNGVIENEGITFRGITVDPRSSDIVYAAAELSSWVWYGQPRNGREFDMTAGVLYKTTDGGQNWSAVWRGDNLARYVWIDPSNPNVVYISTGIFDREAANSDPQNGVPGGVGVLKSTDGGASWSQISNGLINLYVGTLFMHPENPYILLAGTGNNQYYQDNGIYLTTNGGQNWQRVLSDDNINAVEFAISDPQIAYAGSADAIYSSTDGGHTWQRISKGEGWGPPGVRAGFPIDFQVDPRDPQRIFANEYGGGNFLSEDGGHTWTVASTGYTGAQVRSITVDPADGKVFAAARSGIFSSEDGGTHWTGLNSPPAFAMEWYVVAVDPAKPGRVLAANNWNGKIMASPNSGTRWRNVSKHAGENMGWRSLVFAPSNPNIIYAGTSAFYSAGTFDDLLPANGVFVSRDGGEMWKQANDSLSQDANITDLAVAKDNPQMVYAATGNHGLLKTRDGGKSWQAIGPSGRTALSVALHPNQPNVIFLGLAGGIYQSQDGGQNWRPTASGLNPEAAITDIVFDPLHSKVIYIADLFSGVYRSFDGGMNWQALNQGLRTRAVNKLAFSSDGVHLYAATEGEGVFRLDLKGEAPTNLEPTSSPETLPTETQPVIKEDQPTPPPTTEPSPDESSGGGLPCLGAIGPLLVIALFVAFKYRM